MELVECLLTPKELELLRTAEEILFSNINDSWIMLSGSLALAIQGIKKPREADDIDICNYSCETWDLTKTGAKQITGDSDEYDEFFCEFEKNDHKVHYLQMSLGELEDEYLTVTHGYMSFKVLKAKYILEYKMRHAFDDEHGHPQKHKRDLIYILSNN